MVYVGTEYRVKRNFDVLETRGSPRPEVLPVFWSGEYANRPSVVSYKFLANMHGLQGLKPNENAGFDVGAKAPTP